MILLLSWSILCCFLFKIKVKERTNVQWPLKFELSNKLLSPILFFSNKYDQVLSYWHNKSTLLQPVVPSIQLHLYCNNRKPILYTYCWIFSFSKYFSNFISELVRKVQYNDLVFTTIRLDQQRNVFKYFSSSIKLSFFTY